MTLQVQPHVYNANHPFLARLTENRLLTSHESGKETRHLVVDIRESGLTYTPGDSLGVLPSNRYEDVEHLLRALGASGNELVELPREADAISLREALFTRLYFLAGPSRKLLATMGERASDPQERADAAELLAMPPEELRAYLGARHVVDILEQFPSARFEAQEFVGFLKRLTPRLYSIASSQRVHPEEVHLTIAAVRYEAFGRARVGVGSTFGIDRVPLGEPVLPVFVSSSHFGLPEDSARDVIMVGPGTGVAPFRGFLQDRQATGASGRNWLFFGEQHAATDYLYGEELDAWHASGLLTRLDLAWSRDQEEKVYVQHKMQQHAAELWQWLEGGAHLYVCGDAKRMAKDVEATLLGIIQTCGGLDEVAATAYLKDLRKAKRYQKDVY